MLSAKCGSSGVKIWHSQFYSIADRSRGGECGVFPAHAASAAGGSAPRSNAARSGYLGGFLVLPGIPGGDQDFHEVGREVERAEVVPAKHSLSQSQLNSAADFAEQRG